MENTRAIQSGTKDRWLQLVLGMLVMLFAGIIYSWSILKLPFTSEFGWTAAQLGVNYTITILCFCLGGFFSGLLAKKTGIRLRMVVGALLTCAGFMITSRIDADGILLLYLSYGTMAGLGIGITYNTVLATVMSWFPDRKGAASGSLLLAFALTTLVIGNAAEHRIESSQWRGTYLALAVCTGCVILLASLFLKTPSRDTVFSKPKKRRNETPSCVFERKDYTALQMIRRLSFWLLFVFLIILAAVGNAAISFAKDILIEAGATKKLAVLLVGVISLFNGFGRLVAGTLYDRIGLKKTLYVMSGVSILATFTVVLALATDVFALGLVGIGLCYFTYGFVPTTATTLSGEFYGTKNLALNMSIMTLHMIPAAFIATLAGNLQTATGSFQSIFLILAVGTLVALGINLGIKKP